MPSLSLPSEALDSQNSISSYIRSDIQNEETYVFQGHGFLIDNLGFLLNPELDCEVVENVQTCALPGTASWLIGMTHLRGKIIPVFDFSALLFNQSKSLKNRRYLFVDPNHDGFAILIHDMPFRMNLKEDHRLERLNGIPDILLPFCKNLFHNDKVWIEVDYKSLFKQQANYLQNSFN